MAGANQFKAQEFIDAIPKTGGIISTIAKKVGCSWHTAKKYIDNYPTVAKAYADECEGVLDAAESVVLEGIKGKDISVSKWYLTMKGRQRGYAPTQRQEVEVAGDVILKFSGNVNPEEL